MHRENALDLTQDIFVSMLRSIGSFEGSRSSLRTWLYRIATNRVIDHFRSRSHRDTKLSRPLEDFDLAEEGDFTLELVRQEEVGRVLELIRTFDIRAQEIIRLKLFAQRTFAEIAQLLELPDSTVKTNYYASIRRIKHQFKEERHEQTGETEAGGRRTADI
ncbi:RNA polymerase sigma factor [Saccharibacillus qingshengii]|uniref:RNA polymerase sigma factor n=1 Tax=Saccharibacillus qingshengii TaxID=1763540 RepID=UPI0015580BFE|nr:sigma-70 family RNA polymerase sigma factor [Saccharibacillus qingshengii]